MVFLPTLPGNTFLDLLSCHEHIVSSGNEQKGWAIVMYDEYDISKPRMHRKCGDPRTQIENVITTKGQDDMVALLTYPVAAAYEKHQLSSSIASGSFLRLPSSDVRC